MKSDEGGDGTGEIPAPEHEAITGGNPPFKDMRRFCVSENGEVAQRTTIAPPAVVHFIGFVSNEVNP